MTPRRAGALLAALLMMAALAAPAAAQDYPPDAAECAVSVTTPVPGQTITVECEGWMPNSEVTITLQSEPRVLGTASVDGDGNIEDPITIPSDVPPGDHTLRIAGTNAEGEDRHVDIALTVAEPDAEADPDAPLAATGMDSWLGALVGVGLIGVGGGAVFAARRRQADPQA